MVNFSEQRFVHIRLLENQKYLSNDQSLRVGLIYKGANEESLPNVDFYAIDEEGIISKKIHSTVEPYGELNFLIQWVDSEWL